MFDDFRVDSDEFEMVGHWRAGGDGGGRVFAGLNGLSYDGPVKCGAGSVGEGLPESLAHRVVVSLSDYFYRTGETELFPASRKIGDDFSEWRVSQVRVFFCFAAAGDP